MDLTIVWRSSRFLSAHLIRSNSHWIVKISELIFWLKGWSILSSKNEWKRYELSVSRESAIYVDKLDLIFKKLGMLSGGEPSRGACVRSPAGSASGRENSNASRNWMRDWQCALLLVRVCNHQIWAPRKLAASPRVPMWTQNWDTCLRSTTRPGGTWALGARWVINPLNVFIVKQLLSVV